MTKAIQISEHGGAEVLKLVEVAVPEPAENEICLQQTAIGLNYIDVYHRTGLYPVPNLPCVLGMEAAGVVESVGNAVTHLKPGDRVAYASPPLGAYAERRCIAADRVVLLPQSIDDQQAAAMMLQGMTVEYLIQRTYKVQPGDWVLWHAAAGGVGLIAMQWLAHLGANVIGTVGSAEKAALAKQHGCQHVINYRSENILDQVRAVTDGRGVDVVYDSVGKDTFASSLDSLKPRGMMVSFGNASGPVADFNLGVLSQKGSLFITRPTLMTYTADAGELQKSAGDLFSMVSEHKLKINIKQTYPLGEVATAHRDLEARKTIGSTVLIP